MPDKIERYRPPRLVPQLALCGDAPGLRGGCEDMTLEAEAADVVARLRAMAGPVKPNLCDDAADLIERLVRKLEHYARRECGE